MVPSTLLAIIHSGWKIIVAMRPYALYGASNWNSEPTPATSAITKITSTG